MHGRWRCAAKQCLWKCSFKNIDWERITAELESRRIVIVTDFRGLINTMIIQPWDGAVRIQRQLPWQHCMRICVRFTPMWKGVYTADPKLFQMQGSLKRLHMMKCLSWQLWGQSPSQSFCGDGKEIRCLACCRSSLNEAEGTVVKEVSKMEKMLVSGLPQIKMSRVSQLQV